jgi:hypothetical protein
MSVSLNINNDNLFFNEGDRKSSFVVPVFSFISFSEHRADYQYILPDCCFSVHHYSPEVSSFDDKCIKWFQKIITLYEAIQKGWR